MLGQGRTNASWWRCRLNWRRELPRTGRLPCLSKKRGSFLAWRPRSGMSMPRFAPFVGRCYENPSTGPAVANGSRLIAKGTRTCPRIRSSLHPNATGTARVLRHCNRMFPDFARITCQCNPHLSRFRSRFHTNATDTARIPRKCNLSVCKIRPNYTQM